ncbi:Ribosomal protein S18 acetylase RimI [Anaerovirgula multivorans]|uniref:Ribosomal protein S18 acetylase RimI n=1 Tax=Anaerovirgula multivorans TaxID=312168 RepID=A0A239IXB1_9FIRM|nr:GNAT family N-acetyltransferase [Anaerovirgula multivorans]SNS97858.1 Ribosomal protein S18 acetylase RimI [Anaerovirgula multivorans]
MNTIELIEFEEKYHNDFKRLSYEWLEKYVSVEPEDERILSNPKEVIIDKGGSVFLAKYGEEIVGTVSLIRVNDTTFEIAKLAVTEKYQGLGIGKKLMEHCLYVSRQKNTRKIILYTNHKLNSAIALYKKFNFIEVPIINNKYIESDLKMELYL